jgi:NADH:ubiquinone oxidoreductase subunit 5 (subunit L)/multisubunit Na+/H+ antiporter MnhA subunit
MAVPLMVLAALSLGAGFVETPELLGGKPVFTDFVRQAGYLHLEQSWVSLVSGPPDFAKHHTGEAPSRSLPEGESAYEAGPATSQVAPLPSAGAEVASAITAAASLLGLVLAWWFYLRRLAAARAAAESALARFWRGGWGFDWLYGRLLVRPFVTLARLNKDDIIDFFYEGLAALAALLHRLASATVTGRVRWYAAVIALGAVLAIAAVVWL